MAILAERKNVLINVARKELRNFLSDNISLEELIAKAWGILPAGRDTAITNAITPEAQAFLSFRTAVNNSNTLDELKDALAAYIAGNPARRNKFKELIGAGYELP